MSIWETDKLLLFIGFVIPGFISLKVYELLIPGPYKETSKQLVDAVAYSCVNYALLFAPILWIGNENIRSSHFPLYASFYFFVLFLAPVLWVVLWRFIREMQFFQDNAPHPIQRPWDFVFSKREPFWVRVTLKDGTKIGGRYAANSFTSSPPSEDQIYLEETWVLNEKGEFERPKRQSAGVILMSSDIMYIELMNYLGDSSDERKETDS